MMKIKMQLTLKDNVRATFYLVYHKPFSVVMIVFGVLFIPVFLINYIKGVDINYISYFLLFYSALVLCYPFILYFNIKRHYNSTKSLHEEIVYEFTDETIEVKGESFCSNFSWKNIYQVKESKIMFYLFLSKYSTLMLPKRFFSAEEILEFRELVKRKGVKHTLRKNKNHSKDRRNG